MGSQNKWRAGVEGNETNLMVEAEFTGDEKRDRKSSPNLRRKFAGALGFETSALDLGR
jgi:hypothetical protein